MQILTVMVRDNTPINESETLRGLCAALSLDPDLAQEYELLIWDNSPEALSNPELPISRLGGACHLSNRHQRQPLQSCSRFVPQGGAGSEAGRPRGCTLE